MRIKHGQNISHIFKTAFEKGGIGIQSFIALLLRYRTHVLATDAPKVILEMRSNEATGLSNQGKIPNKREETERLE